VLHLVDADLYSSELDHVKPHPEAFRAICRALDVDPRRSVYVGDRVFEDVHGPQQVGMRAIWIPHSDIPASQRVEVTAVPDARAHQLLDVLDIVDGWIAA
jgi:putative hydrolase of the HAD superfamily